MPSPPPTETLSAEARRLHLRYTVEIVERFNLCPFARKAREDDEVDRPVLLHDDFDPAPTLAVIAELEARPHPPPVAIVLYPRLRLSCRRFDELASRIKEADQKRHGGKPVYVSATFHPEYPLPEARFLDRSPASLVPWFRRSPDPSLQLVRLAILEEARGAGHGKFHFDGSAGAWAELLRRTKTLSVPERIAADNHEAFVREGREVFEALYRDILDDRDRTYARLAGA